MDSTNQPQESTVDLRWSITQGDIDQVKKIVEANPSLVESDLASGRKAIHYAADYGQVEVIDYLLTRGADVNAVDKHGVTALLAAIYEGHTSSVQLLLSKGARKDLKAPDESNYIDCAEKPEIKQLLAA